MNDRQMFEAWLCPMDDHAMLNMTLQREPNGQYAQALVRLQWKTWQAALAALRTPTRCAQCDYLTELQYVCEQCGERYST